eukprot:10750340-Ditylum_brightwellii.AAC.1
MLAEKHTSTLSVEEDHQHKATTQPSRQLIAYTISTPTTAKHKIFLPSNQTSFSPTPHGSQMQCTASICPSI